MTKLEREYTLGKTNCWLSFNIETKLVSGWTQCEEEASCVEDCSLLNTVKGYYIS